MNQDRKSGQGEKSKEKSLSQEHLVRLFTSMLDSTQNGIIALDNAARIVFMNKAAEAIVGLAFSENRGKLITDVAPESQLHRVIATGDFETGKKITVGNRVIITNRNPIYHHGKVIGAVGVFQDISNLEAIATELQLVKGINTELNAIIDSIYDGLIIFDGCGTILRANSAYEDMSGISAGYLVGKHANDLIKEGLVSESVTQQVIETKKPASLSITINSGKVLFHSAVPVMDDKGEIFRIVMMIRDLTELNNLKQKLEEAKNETSLYRDELKRIKEKSGTKDLVIFSPMMKDIFDLALRLAHFDTTVLITGESGVGKEVMARYIHENSLRKDNPFIRVNCGAIPEQLLESELFGYEPGAFTGAKKEGKKGLLEAANGGSFLLDEISELPYPLQVKLLRVLQEQEFFRVGSNKPISVDIRFIAASNVDLLTRVQTNLFRPDLYYRLNVAQIRVPPLRERKEEIPGLAMIFLRNFNEKYNLNKQMTNQATMMLMNQDWPGNIRELENTIERLAIMCHGDVIDHNQLPNDLLHSHIPHHHNITGNLKEALESLEKEMIANAYLQAGCTRMAGLLLGINQSTVVKKMQKYNLNGKLLSSTNMSS